MGSVGNNSLHSIVDLAIEGLSPAAQAVQCQVVEIGSAHIVVLLEGTAAVRMGRDPNMAVEMRKRQELVDSIPVSTGFQVPRSLSPVAELDGFSAVVTELIPGGPCPAVGRTLGARGFARAGVVHSHRVDRRIAD